MGQLMETFGGGRRPDLAVLNEPENVFKAVVVEEHSLQDWSVRAL